MKLSTFICVGFLSMFSTLGFASGSADYGNDSSYERQKQVDPAYEQGKTIFTGRNAKYKKYKFCLAASEGNEVEKIKRKSLKEFKGSSYPALASKIVKCDEPDKAISDLLSRNDLSLLVYYLDKRYKLKLDQ